MDTLRKRSVTLLVASAVILVLAGAVFYHEYNKKTNPPDKPVFSNQSGMYGIVDFYTDWP